MRDEAHRARVLSACGASGTEIEALLEYNRNVFDHTGLKLPVRFPLADEPFVSAWERYAAEAETEGTFTCLQRRLVQLRFPIREGMSGTEAYRAATRCSNNGSCDSGVPCSTMSSNTARWSASRPSRIL